MTGCRIRSRLEDKSNTKILIARTQFRVGRGAARRQCALEIRGNHLDSFFRRDLAPDHDVVRIGILPQFVEAPQDVAETQACAVFECSGPKHVSSELDGVL